MHREPPRGHLQRQAHDNLNALFSHLKGTHIHVILYNICRICMSYHIFFEAVCFVLAYSTHIWNEYVAGSLLKIKNAKNEACL